VLACTNGAHAIKYCAFLSFIRTRNRSLRLTQVCKFSCASAAMPPAAFPSLPPSFFLFFSSKGRTFRFPSRRPGASAGAEKPSPALPPHRLGDLGVPLFLFFFHRVLDARKSLRDLILNKLSAGVFQRFYRLLLGILSLFRRERRYYFPPPPPLPLPTEHIANSHPAPISGP